MVRKFMIAAAIGALITGSAAADRTKTDLNYGMLHWIRDTVCTPGREIVFVPVSHDVKSRDKNWVVIGMDDPDPDTAHVVTLNEKTWLKTHGCDEDVFPEVHIASHDKSVHNKSADLDL